MRFYRLPSVDGAANRRSHRRHERSIAQNTSSIFNPRASWTLVSTKDRIPKTRDRDCKAVNQVRCLVRENERFANGERNRLSQVRDESRRRLENGEAGKYLAVLALRAQERGRSRNGPMSTTGVGESGKKGIGSPGTPHEPVSGDGTWFTLNKR